MKDDNIIQKIVPSSPNFQTELAEKIADIVPEAVSDGRIDVTKLRELINGDAEDSRERFGLFWPGKSRAQASAQTPTSATLIPVPEESVDWENTKNIYIEGDNLEVLKALQNSYRRKIKMIYIDPPYNTGKEFIYPDNYQEGLQTYLEYTGQKDQDGNSTESKRETVGRKHTNWLNMMYPRLQLAKSLLTDDGAIFISIDDNEVNNLTKLCEEIFGNDSIDKFIWEKVGDGDAGAGKMKAAKRVRIDHEYILACRKMDVEFKRRLELPNFKNEYGNLDNDPRGPYKAGNMSKSEDKSSSSGKNYYTVTAPGGKSFSRQWHFDIETFNKLNNDNRIYWGKQGNNAPSIKIFLNEPRQLVNSSLLNGLGSATSASKRLRELFDEKDLFDNPKPTELIKRFIYFQTDNDDIIIDFFSGTGTTAHAVMQLNAEDGGNRTHIQVQLPEPTDEKSEAYKAGYKTISDIGKERIRRAGKKILTDYADKLKERDAPLDIGFRVYKLAPSNFVEWDEDKAKDDIGQAVLAFADNKKPDASPEALLSEIMLQNKVKLDAKIEKKELANGNWVYVVDDGNLIAYVDEKQITESQASEIADMAPGKLIIIDSAFNGNDALKINIANICKEKFIKEFKTI